MSKIEVVTLEKPTDTPIALIVGSVIALAGIIMMLTIVLILPGIGTLLTGGAIAYANIPTAKTPCPACDLEIKAKSGEKNVKCPHCETVTPIIWADDKKAPAN